MEVLVKHFGSTFSVAAIPVLKDNYTYVIHDRAANALSAVDAAADTAPVARYAAAHAPGAALRAILSTHRHWDHTGGNLTLPALLARPPGPPGPPGSAPSGPSAPSDSAPGSTPSPSTPSPSGPSLSGSAGPAVAVIGGAGDDVPGATRTVRGGETIRIGALDVDVVEAPCHTKGHVLFRVHNPEAPEDGAALFTGDTMFVGGIGAFFEGNAADMCSALQKIYSINEKSSIEDADSRTFVFPGHEYTVNFIKFARDTIPAGHRDAAFITAQLEKYENSIAQHRPTVPSTLAEEKRQNLFLRTCDKAFVTEMNHGDTAEALMQYLYDTCP